MLKARLLVMGIQTTMSLAKAAAYELVGTCCLELDEPEPPKQKFAPVVRDAVRSDARFLMYSIAHTVCGCTV